MAKNKQIHSKFEVAFVQEIIVLGRYPSHSLCVTPNCAKDNVLGPLFTVQKPNFRWIFLATHYLGLANKTVSFLLFNLQNEANVGYSLSVVHSLDQTAIIMQPARRFRVGNEEYAVGRTQLCENS